MSRLGGMVRSRAVVAVAIVCFLAAALTALLTLPVDRWLLWLVGWLRDAGPLGAAVYVLTFLVGAVTLAPGSILTAIGGFLYGPFWGVVLASPTTCVGATISLLIGRYLIRDRVRRLVERDLRFAAIDRAVGENGFKLVLLMRMSPLLPFGILNYALSATRIKVRHFALGSLIGMLPGTCLYAYLGSAVTSLTELMAGKRPETGPWQQALYWVGLGATLTVSIVATRIARRALREAVEGRAEARIAPHSPRIDR